MLLASSTAAGETTAEPTVTGATAPEQSMSVELQVIGSDTDIALLKQAFSAHQIGTTKVRWSQADTFHPLELLRIARVQKQLPRGRTVRCWIDLGDSKTARLYFVAPVHDRFMLRELEVQPRLGSFEAESIAQIVELSVSALASDAAAGMSRSEAQEALAVATPEVAPRAVTSPKAPAPKVQTNAPTYTFDLAASFGIRPYSTEVPWVMGPLVGVALARMHGNYAGRIELSVGYEFPRAFETDVGGATLSNTTWRVRAEQLFSITRAARLWLGVNFATGIDIVRATPSVGTTPGNYRFSDPRVDTPLVLSPGVSWTAQLSDHLSLRLLLTLDITPKPVLHTLSVNGTPIALTEAQRLRPFAALGLVFR